MWFDVSFDESKAGLATVGYRQYNNAGGDAVARTTTNVVEIGNGGYGVEVDIANATVGVQWDTGEVSPIFAQEDVNSKLRELWELQGLDIDNPMTVTPTSRVVSADVSQTISGDGVITTTVTRDP